VFRICVAVLPSKLSKDQRFSPPFLAQPQVPEFQADV